MVPSHSPATARERRRRVALPGGLLAAAFTAGAAAVVVSLAAAPVRAAPVGLELAALAAGGAAVWLGRSRGRGRVVERSLWEPAPAETAVRPEPTAGPGAEAGAAGAPGAAPPTGAPRDAAGPDERAQESARRAFVNLARRIQAVVNRQLRELREMQARHGADAEVFSDLLTVDHATALIGRLADSLAVLGGDRPGRRWHRPIPLIGVLRGAMSRITEYRRVDLGPLAEGVAVDGAVVEALVHALAELLDNATRYSPPESRVALGAYVVGDGIAIEVEDAGVGLGADAAARAELVLGTEDFGLELAALGETPRLGLAVAGRLARAVGFEVALHRAEPGGGVRAVILVPARLLREPQPQETSGDRVPRPPAHRAATQATAVRAVAVTSHGLPQRHRYVPAAGRQAAGQRAPGSAPGPAASAAAAAAAAAGTPPEPPGTPGPRPGLWLGAFQAGLHGEGLDRDGEVRESENGARP